MAEIERWGESFRIAEKVGLRPLMRFAQVARRGVDADDMAGLAAMGDLLDQCIHEDDLGRFDVAADKARADGEELMAVVTEVFSILSARPTSLPSDSSGGQPNTNESSVGGSSSPVIARLEAQGRPDLALLVTRAQESRASA